MRKIVLVAAIAAIVLLGGCAAPSERPGQATPSPTPTPSVTTSSETAAPTPTPTPTESVEPAATPTPTPTESVEPAATPALVNNWPALLASHPEVVTDLLKAGWTLDQVAAQAAIRTSDGKVPDATVKVAFGNIAGGALRSTGDCKASSGECPTNALVEGLLPLIKPEGEEPLRDPSRGVIVVAFSDGNPVLLQLTLRTPEK